jgi:hypothetical protein
VASRALTAARTDDESLGVTAQGPRINSRTSHDTALGAFLSRYASICDLTWRGSCSGTNRAHSLASARPGTMVFTPVPVYPELIPHTSRLGRAPMRSAVVYPSSPVKAFTPANRIQS